VERFAGLLEIKPTQVLCAGSPEDTILQARDRDPQVVVVDMDWRAPRPSTADVAGDSWDWLRALHQAAPRAKVLLVADGGSEEAAWDMVRRGALDCLSAESSSDRWSAALHNALVRSTLEREGTAWKEIQALLEVSHAVTSGDNLATTLQTIMDSAMMVTGADSGSLMLLADDGEDALEIAAARGLASEVVAGTRIKAGEGVAGWVAEHGEPVLLRDGIENDPRFQHLKPRKGLESSVCVPIRTRGGDRIGVLCLNTESRRQRLSHRDLTLMLIYAGAVGTLIEAARALESERRARRELERTLRKHRATEAQLIQSGKMAAVGLLASGIAHEFNNLLTGILGMAQIAQETGSEEHQQKALRVAVDNCRKARDVVKNLLSFAKPYSKPDAVVDAAAALENVLGLVRREIGARGIRLVRRIHPAPPVRAARGGLEQVLLNLVLNATQAIPDGQEGVLTVGVRGRQDDVVIAIADNGSGIKPEYVGKIFDPFFSTKSLLGGGRQQQGGGLGLSVSFGIIRGFGGTIRVRTTEGIGTLFTIRLPKASEEDLAGATPRRETRRLPKVKGGRVLVLDDEWWVREFLRELLTQAGFEVAVAADGAEALEIAEDLAPDVVLADVVLDEGERGPDVVARLKERTEKLCVVYMTGRLAGDKTEMRLREESDGFLAKPFEGHDVVASLQLALGSRA
jgi:signal transduction histidine kinase/DNA-binding response OmpR family regulator